MAGWHSHPGTDPSGPSAVKIIAEGALFAGGLGMKIKQKQICRHVFEDLVGCRKGARSVKIHIVSADQVGNTDPIRACVHHRIAVARQRRVQVIRADYIPPLVQIVADLPIGKRMVAQSYNIGARIEYLVGKLGRDASAAGVFAVDHCKIGADGFFELAELCAQYIDAGFAAYVAYYQYFHVCHLLSIDNSYFSR